MFYHIENEHDISLLQIWKLLMLSLICASYVIKVDIQRKLRLDAQIILCLCYKLGDEKCVKFWLITYWEIQKEQRELSKVDCGDASTSE